jgi:hypothetical protein
MTDLDKLRGLGWAVAVHNDYRQDGQSMTFWLLTKDGRAVKGEAATDAEALAQVLRQVEAGDAGEPDVVPLVRRWGARTAVEPSPGPDSHRAVEVHIEGSDLQVFWRDRSDTSTLARVPEGAILRVDIGIELGMGVPVTDEIREFVRGLK